MTLIWDKYIGQALLHEILAHNVDHLILFILICPIDGLILLALLYANILFFSSWGRW